MTHMKNLKVMIFPNPIDLRISGILNVIKRSRVNQGISQYEMSSRLNVSQNTYFKIEKGKTKLDVYRLIQISYKLIFKNFSLKN